MLEFISTYDAHLWCLQNAEGNCCCLYIIYWHFNIYNFNYASRFNNQRTKKQILTVWSTHLHRIKEIPMKRTKSINRLHQQRLTTETHKTLRALAPIKGTSMEAVLELAVKSYLTTLTAEETSVFQFLLRKQTQNHKDTHDNTPR